MANELGGENLFGESVATRQARVLCFLRQVGCAFVLVISAFPVCVSAADAAAGRVAMPPELASAIAAYDKATVDKDIARLEALVRDDYVLVNSDMSVQKKRSYLEDFKVQGFHINQYTLSDPILIVRSDSALTGGFFQLSWVQDGRSLERRTRIIHFWKRMRGSGGLLIRSLPVSRRSDEACIPFLNPEVGPPRFARWPQACGNLSCRETRSSWLTFTGQRVRPHEQGDMPRRNHAIRSWSRRNKKFRHPRESGVQCLRVPFKVTGFPPSE